jgi:hypothetical protein
MRQSHHQQSTLQREEMLARKIETEKMRYHQQSPQQREETHARTRQSHHQQSSEDREETLARMRETSKELYHQQSPQQREETLARMKAGTKELYDGLPKWLNFEKLENICKKWRVNREQQRITIRRQQCGGRNQINDTINGDRGINFTITTEIKQSVKKSKDEEIIWLRFMAILGGWAMWLQCGFLFLSASNVFPSVEQKTTIEQRHLPWLFSEHNNNKKLA